MRISHPNQEGVLQGGLFLKVSALLHPLEVRSLFNALRPFTLYRTNTTVLLDKAKILLEDFFQTYEEYWDFFIKGLVIPSAFHSQLALTLARAEDSLYAMPVGSDGKFLIRQTKPCVQMQHHQFIVSKEDGSFHSNVCAKDAISWGLTFSFPQLYQDVKTKEFIELAKFSNDPDRDLFTTLQTWIRHNSVPCRFEGYKTPPFRIGKQVKLASMNPLQQIPSFL